MGWRGCGWRIIGWERRVSATSSGSGYSWAKPCALSSTQFSVRSRAEQTYSSRPAGDRQFTAPSGSGGVQLVKQQG